MTAISNGGAAKRVTVIDASDLKANGGAYSLEQRAPVRVYGVTDADTKAQGGAYAVEGNVAMPVYVVGSAEPEEATIAPIPMIGVTGALTAGSVATPVIVVGGSLPGGDPAYSERVLALYPESLIQYLPLSEASGPQATDLSGNARHGTYSAAGVTYSEPGIGDGNTAVKFSGADTHVAIGSTTIGAAWNGDKFSMVAWGRVDDAARWADAASYRYLTHLRAADATYYVVMGKSTTPNQLEWRRRTGGPIVSITHTYAPSGTLDWFCMGMTFDIATPRLRCYLDGALISESTSVNLTAWGANPPTGGATVLMAGSITLQEWIGWGANSAIWAGVELTAEEMASIGQVTP
jgi:hypothetical protein